MDWLISFAQETAQILSGVVNFVVTLVEGLVSLVTMLPDLIQDMTSAVNFLPSVLLTFFSVSLTVTIIFLIAGRGKGGE